MKASMAPLTKFDVVFRELVKAEKAAVVDGSCPLQGVERDVQQVLNTTVVVVQGVDVVQGTVHRTPPSRC